MNVRLHWVLYSLLAVLTVCGVSCSSRSADGPPYEPAEALSTLEVEDGFHVELFASEPLLKDPVAMEVDEHGRIYVVEDPGYQELNTKGVGSIILLTDTDSDGYPDQRTVFADGFNSPRGVMRWKAGLLVTDAPQVYYLEDTDGDNRADKKEVILTGFGHTNMQLGVNTPVYGLDNWIYLAHFTGNDYPHFTGRKKETQKTASGRNVRFRPDTYQLEPLAGRSQFGHTFDQWGHHLLNSNSNHIYQEVIASRYLTRNPDLLVASATKNISDHGAAAKVYPITDHPEYQLFTDAGVITSASGLTAYLGGLFPEKYRGATFVAESVHNLVHVDKLSKAGVTLQARRMNDAREFLASTDSWFRPVNFYVGPDGALYVLDYYRDIIEQKRFLSEEVVNSGRLYSGTERGRIYRIAPKESSPPTWTNALDLQQAPAEELVDHLERSNLWWRRTAQRLLVQRGGEKAVESLEVLSRQSASAVARVHALWTLEGLGQLRPALIEAALQHKEAGVRENAIRLAEKRLPNAPRLVEALLAMEDDPDPRVCFQLLAALGELKTTKAQTVRQKLLFDNIENQWMQVAALSAADTHPVKLFEKALDRLAQKQTKGRQKFFEGVGALVGAGQEAGHLHRILQEITAVSAETSDWWRASTLEGLARGLRSAEQVSLGLQKERQRLLLTFFDNKSAAVREGYLQVLEVVGLPGGSVRETVLKEAVDTASDRQQGPMVRADALRLLAQADLSAYQKLFERFITSEDPAPVQRVAVDKLGKIKGKEVGTFLLAHWSSMTPNIRRRAVDGLMNEKERVHMLLEAIENGSVQPSTVGRLRIKRLMLNDDPALRRKARELLANRERAGQEAIKEYRSVLKVQGNLQKGQAVFAQACARCHQVGGRSGVAFGPDLATVKNRGREWLLTHIVQPNRSIAEGFELWNITRKSGEPVKGIITAETASSVTVVQVGGQQLIIPRRNVASMTASSASPMPEGLEAQISKQEMVDLLTYIKKGS